MQLLSGVRLAFVFSLLCFNVTSCYSQPTKTTIAQPGSFALIELYTSEGCSSCPAADRLMPELKKEYGSKLYVLEFHVDYWNRLGWKDPFSNAAYSARQGRYATAFNSESVYTPQAVVNGKAHATGSDKNKLEMLIDKQLAQPSQGSIDVKAITKGSKEVVVNYNTHLSKEEVLNIALVQLSANVDVKRGENSGKQLKHEYIVRSFETTNTEKGAVIMTLPDGLDQGQCHIIAYKQQNDKLGITSVAESDIEK